MKYLSYLKISEFKKKKCKLSKMIFLIKYALNKKTLLHFLEGYTHCSKAFTLNYFPNMETDALK